MLQLAALNSKVRYVDIAHQALAQMQTLTGGGVITQYLLGFGQWLQALAYALSKPREIAIVGDPDSTHTQALLHVVRDGYRPFQVVALRAPEAQPPTVPLLQDRSLVDGRAAAYICRSFTYQTPVMGPEALRRLLDKKRSSPLAVLAKELPDDFGPELAPDQLGRMMVPLP